MKRPDYTDMWEAARVSQFIDPAEHGRWRIKRFTVDERDFMQERVRIMHEAGDDEFERELKLDRQIPVGTYVSLQRKATQRERDENAAIAYHGWMPVMSDTPAEISEHQHALAFAEGRVLVHGLGLGVLVSALLSKPEVTHIDVVEIDPDVIALTGHYYTDDPRVHIHRGDCLRMNWSPEIRWDYVWHDIWTDISWRNLYPDVAEHGISYDMLFDHFRDRAGLQGAWAYPEAQDADDDRKAADEENREWEERFWAADRETQVEMVFDKTVRSHLKGADGRSILKDDDPIPPHIRKWFVQQGLRAHIRKSLTSKSREEFEAERAKRRTKPLGNPNDILNV